MSTQMIVCSVCGKKKPIHSCAGLAHVPLCQEHFDEEYVMSVATRRYVRRRFAEFSTIEEGWINNLAVEEGIARRCKECGQLALRRNFNMYSGMCSHCSGVLNKVGNSYPAGLNFKGSPEDGMFFGVELETFMNGSDYVELRWQRNVIATAVSEAIGDPDDETVYYQNDCTVNGYELTTHPFSLEYHLKTFDWDSAIKTMTDGGMYGTDRSGIHVHVGRDGLDGVDDESLYYFVNHYSDEFIALAQRHNADWAEYYSENRYEANREERNAINVSGHDTVEFRMFKTVMDADVVRAFVELCHAVCTYLKTHSARASWNQFVEFVDNGVYEFLPNYMRSVGVA